MITIITATGDRPVPFELLQKWVKNQTVQPDQWIVIDDGIKEQRPTEPCLYVRRKPLAIDPKHTLGINIGIALKFVKGDKILFFEDDEYYAPTYIEEMSKRLDNFEVVGIGRSKYYFLPKYKWHRHLNMGHASLAQTGFRKSYLDKVKSYIDNDPFIDVKLWRGINKNADNLKIEENKKEYISANGKCLVFDDEGLNLYVGMKGLPGRKGIGVGHKDNGYKADEGKNILKKWIPKQTDFNDYIKMEELS